MALKLTADPGTRIITITAVPVGGLLSLDAVDDIYEPLKDDWLATPTLQQLAFPFRTFGDFKNPTTQIGPYIFFSNDTGWRFWPYDIDHELTINGNLTPEDPTLPVYMPRAGRSILVLQESSAQALTEVITVESLDAAKLRKALLNDMTTNPTTGKITILDDDDTTPILEGDMYEDAARTQLYRGQGAEVRTRLVDVP